MTQEITPLERYIGVKQDLQDLAQQLLIFGTHVHIGIEDRDFLIDAMNVARYFLPHVLCLSTSSPFWMGRNTGLKSYRSIIFRNFPRTGIPPTLRLLGRLRSSCSTRWCAPTASRTAPRSGGTSGPTTAIPTLEFRICDVCTRVDEAVCVAAILQAIIAKLWKLRRDNMTFRVYPLSLIEENKWRAVRYGLDGKLIDFGKRAGVAGPRSDSRADRAGSSTTWSTSSARRARSGVRVHDPREARAPTGSWRRSSGPGI